MAVVANFVVGFLLSVGAGIALMVAGGILALARDGPRVVGVALLGLGTLLLAFAVLSAASYTAS